jgi:hypothetical protein
MMKGKVCLCLYVYHWKSLEFVICSQTASIHNCLETSMYINIQMNHPVWNCDSSLVFLGLS